MNNSFHAVQDPVQKEIWETSRWNLKAVLSRRGPFGAKSIGEIVINTPAPALAHAIANATGIWFKELPITSEQIAMEF